MRTLSSIGSPLKLQMPSTSSTIHRNTVGEELEVNDFESLVFDKADLAESVEDLTDRVTDINARIAELEAAPSSAETTRLLESLEQSKAVIPRVIDDRKKVVQEDGRR